MCTSCRIQFSRGKGVDVNNTNQTPSFRPAFLGVAAQVAAQAVSAGEAAVTAGPGRSNGNSSPSGLGNHLSQPAGRGAGVVWYSEGKAWEGARLPACLPCNQSSNQLVRQPGCTQTTSPQPSQPACLPACLAAGFSTQYSPTRPANTVTPLLARIYIGCPTFQ